MTCGNPASWNAEVRWIASSSRASESLREGSAGRKIGQLCLIETDHGETRDGERVQLVVVREFAARGIGGVARGVTGEVSNVGLGQVGKDGGLGWAVLAGGAGVLDEEGRGGQPGLEQLGFTRGVGQRRLAWCAGHGHDQAVCGRVCGVVIASVAEGADGGGVGRGHAVDHGEPARLAVIAGGVQRQLAKQAARCPPDRRSGGPRIGRIRVAEVAENRFGRAVPQPFQDLAERVLSAVALAVAGLPAVAVASARPKPLILSFRVSRARSGRRMLVMACGVIVMASLR